MHFRIVLSCCALIALGALAVDGVVHTSLFDVCAKPLMALDPRQRREASFLKASRGAHVKQRCVRHPVAQPTSSVVRSLFDSTASGLVTW